MASSREGNTPSTAPTCHCIALKQLPICFLLLLLSLYLLVPSSNSSTSWSVQAKKSVLLFAIAVLLLSYFLKLSNQVSETACLLFTQACTAPMFIWSCDVHFRAFRYGPRLFLNLCWKACVQSVFILKWHFKMKKNACGLDDAYRIDMKDKCSAHHVAEAEPSL